METRNLGRSGLRVSLLALGCGNFGGRLDFEKSRAVIHRALDLGITLFDTADRYYRGGSEETVGRVLGPRRKDVVIATKFGRVMDDETGRLQGGSRHYVMQAVEASLKRLGTDWIDLYQMHVPDPMTPIEETLRALNDLVRQGKVLYIGCSNFQGWMTVEASFVAQNLGTVAFASCQAPYNLLERDPEVALIPALASQGMGLMAYYPLASGFLSGRYRRGAPPPEGSSLASHKEVADRFISRRNFDVMERLEALAARRGRTMIELAFSWLAARPIVSTILSGASTPEQVELNVRSLARRTVDDEIAELDRITSA